MHVLIEETVFSLRFSCNAFHIVLWHNFLVLWGLLAWFQGDVENICRSVPVFHTRLEHCATQIVVGMILRLAWCTSVRQLWRRGWSSLSKRNPAAWRYVKVLRIWWDLEWKGNNIVLTHCDFEAAWVLVKKRTQKKVATENTKIISRFSDNTSGRTSFEIFLVVLLLLTTALLIGWGVRYQSKGDWCRYQNRSFNPSDWRQRDWCNIVWAQRNGCCALCTWALPWLLWRGNSIFYLWSWFLFEAQVFSEDVIFFFQNILPVLYPQHFIRHVSEFLNARYVSDWVRLRGIAFNAFQGP